MAGLLGGAAILMASPAAFATVNMGELVFSGEIEANTCQIDVSDGGHEITLPDVSRLVFQSAGDTAGATPITINLINCLYVDKGRGVKAAFVADAAGDPALERLENQAQDGATDIQVELLDLDGVTPLRIGAADSTQYVTISGSGTAVLKYQARYYALSAAVTAGPVEASATYELVYQ
uniref:fimbrial protein n=1 Tax=Castellaniella defragrans TaxID=75697 RepID=UPI0033403F9D